ncbi:MAG: F0F1 ATP synthase subunit B [Thermodesulfovibrionales bacterium]
MKYSGFNIFAFIIKPKTRKIFSSMFLIFSLVFVSLAFGAEEAGHGAEWKEWLWKILNFAILVFILVKFLGKPFKNFLKQRTELIEKTLNEAREAKELAARALAEVEDRLKSKDKEIQDIISISERSARVEYDQLIKQGEEMKEKVIAQAKSNIDYELKAAIETIKAEAVEIAMELAEKKIKERLSETEQMRLIEESLSRMEAKK